MTERIDIEITGGKIDIDMEGFHGSKCAETIDELTKHFKTTEKKVKYEAYQKQPRHQQIKKRGK